MKEVVENLAELFWARMDYRTATFLYRKFLAKDCAKNAERYRPYVDLDFLGRTLPTKGQCLVLLAATYSDEVLFRGFLGRLPRKFAQLYEAMAWHGDIALPVLREKWKLEVVEGKAKYGYFYHLKPEFCLFSVRDSAASYHLEFASSFLGLEKEARELIKPYFKKPSQYNLHPIPEPTKTQFQQTESRIGKLLPLYHTFVNGGHVKYTKSTSKVLKSSLKQFEKFSSCVEFYPGGDKDLAYLKSRLIIGFLEDSEQFDSGADPLAQMKALMSHFFDGAGFSYLVWLDHIKGGNSYYYDTEESQRACNRSLLFIVEFLPLYQWVSLEDIGAFASYRDLSFPLLAEEDMGQFLYIYRCRKSYGYDYRERQYLGPHFYNEIVVRPMIKAFFFWAAAFGLVEIAYDLPRSEKLKDGNKPFLSVYDGLKYVKLTALGAYLFGRTEQFDGELSPPSTAEVSLDERHLIITLLGEDKIKALALETVGVAVTRNRYKVDFASFLREAQTTADVEAKIQWFKSEICADPPPNWESFFRSAPQRVNPLTLKNGWMLFELNEDPGLTRLICRDAVLRKLTVKAEGRWVLIRGDDLSKVRRRLERHGYLMQSPA